MPRGIYPHKPLSEDHKRKIKEFNLGHHRNGWKLSKNTRIKMGLSQLGKKHPHTEVTKQKIRDKKKGILPPQFKGYWLGRKQTPEHRLKTLKTLAINPHRFQKGQVAPMKGKTRPDIAGENSRFWKGGISPIYGKLRRQRLKKNGGSHTQGEWETVKIQYGYKCAICLKSEEEVKLTKDHIIPVTKGGSDFIENIQPLCVECNSRKNNKI